MKLWTTVLLLVPFSTILYSQTPIFDEKSCSTVKRLDAKGGVYENTGIQNQGNLSTCYANTASMALLGFHNKENPSNKINQLSWVQLAFLTQKSHLEALDNAYFENDYKLANEVFARGGRLCPLYEAIKGKNLCELDAKFLDEASFKKNLESNPGTLIEVTKRFEDLLSIDAFYNQMQNPNSKVISPQCLQRLDRKLDKVLSNKILKKLQPEIFEKLLPFKKAGVSSEDFIAALREKFIIDNFTKSSDGQNLLSAHKSLQIYHQPSFSFNYEEPKDKKFISSYFYQDAQDINNDAGTQFFQGLMDLQDKIDALFKEDFEKIHLENKKDLVECIDQSLSGLNDILISFGGDGSECKQTNLSTKVADTFIELLSRGFNPNYIIDLLNSKNLHTRSDLFESMMKGLYTNCDVKVPEDLTCDLAFSDDVPEGFTSYDLVFDTTVDQIDEQGTSAYLALAWDFSRSNAQKERDAESRQEQITELQGKLKISKDEEERRKLKVRIEHLENNEGSHAVSVIGYSKGCGPEKKRCILVQNSHGEESLSDDQDFFHPSIIPDSEIIRTYEFDGKAESYREVQFGKFWVCDEELINKNFESFSRLRK